MRGMYFKIKSLERKQNTRDTDKERMTRLTPKTFAILCLAVMGGTLPALAQDVRNVVDQARYPLAADGIRSGSIIFSPTIGISQSYDDNVYRDSENEKEDFVTTLNAGLNVATDFDLHSLFFRTGGTLGYYAKNNSENYEDFNVAAGGTLDVDYETFFSLYSSYSRAHESREDPDAPNTDEPVEYDLFQNKLGFTRALGIVKLQLEGLFDRFAFKNSTLNGNFVNNGGRDRNIYGAYGKLSYEYFPGYNVYTSVKHDWRKYDESVAVNRDSEGYDVQVGTDVAITGKVKGDVYVGYLDRSYEDDSLEDISAVNYGGSLIWNMTGLTSITASISRAVEETTFGDASGNLQTRYDVDVDHLVRDNLFLNVGAGYRVSEYESNANAGREDDVYQARVGLEYIPYDGTTVRTGYNYSMRDSNRPNEDYTSNRVFVGLAQQF